jgi:hypothetical protein
MNTRIHNIKKRSIITLSCLLFSIGAMAQAFSSGGGSATGYKSTLGNQNTASGNYSFAAGWGSQATGQTSIALGYYSKAEGLNSMALGMYAYSQNAYGISIGRGLSSTKPLSNTTSGIMLGMYSNVPTLYISPSSGENRTGKVAIGNVTSPSAKLHIAGDGVENADILLASTGTNKSVIQFRSSDNNITVGSDNVMKFNAPNMQFYPTGQVAVNGAFKATGNVTLSGLAGSSTKVLTVGTNGQLSSVEYSTFNDNLGNHTATQNINLNGKKIVSGTSGTGGIFVSTGGKVRIGTGTTTPTNALEVNGTTVSSNLKISGLASSTQKVLTVGTGGQVSSTDVSTFADNMGDHTATQNINLNGKKIVGSSASTNGLFVGTNGNVRIGAGSGNPGNALEVNGIVRSKEVLVEITGWSDFVFEKDYKLMSLAEVEQFVKQHGHLPDVPSANEVEENGIGLGEMNALLLQKIEEMTLHLIEMEKRIQELESDKQNMSK